MVLSTPSWKPRLSQQTQRTSSQQGMRLVTKLVLAQAMNATLLLSKQQQSTSTHVLASLTVWDLELALV